MKLYEKITILRKRQGMSQEDLAKALDISRQSVYKWESGLSYPEIDKIKKLSEIFKVSIDALLNDDTDITAEVAQPVSAAPKFRPVFVSSRSFASTYKSDYQHGYCEKSKRKNKKSAEIFRNVSVKFNSELRQSGYTCIYPQPDLAVAFFCDEKHDACGFYFDGCERFVCPIENLIGATVSPTYGGTNNRMPVGYEFIISYFTEDGKTAQYSIRFYCGRNRFLYEECNKHPEQYYRYMDFLSDETSKNLNKIILKITELKARGELIKSGAVKAENINVADYAAKQKSANEQTDAFEQNVIAECKKSNAIRLGIILGAVALVIVAVIVEIAL